jgi:hypothetical protein
MICNCDEWIDTIDYMDGERLADETEPMEHWDLLQAEWRNRLQSVLAENAALRAERDALKIERDQMRESLLTIWAEASDFVCQ